MIHTDIQELPVVTLEDIGCYLSSRQPHDPIGFPRRCSSCLIAQVVMFLYPEKHLEGHDLIDVDGDKFVFIAPNLEEYHVPLSEKILAVINAFDNLGVPEARSITKEEYLRYMAICYPDLLSDMYVTDGRTPEELP